MADSGAAAAAAAAAASDSAEDSGEIQKLRNRIGIGDIYENMPGRKIFTDLRECFAETVTKEMSADVSRLKEKRADARARVQERLAER